MNLYIQFWAEDPLTCSVRNIANTLHIFRELLSSYLR